MFCALPVHPALTLPSAQQINWRDLAGISAERVFNDTDVETLQHVLSTLAFGAFDAASPDVPALSSNDPHALLLRLSQFTIQYLLHTQTLLLAPAADRDRAAEQAKAAAEEANARARRLASKLDRRDAALKRAQHFLSTYDTLLRSARFDPRKLLEAGIPEGGPLHTCHVCGKVFPDFPSLREHHVKHSELDASDPHHDVTPPKPPQRWQDMRCESEAEIAELKAQIVDLKAQLRAATASAVGMEANIAQLRAERDAAVQRAEEAESRLALLQAAPAIPPPTPVVDESRSVLDRSRTDSEASTWIEHDRNAPPSVLAVPSALARWKKLDTVFDTVRAMNTLRGQISTAPTAASTAYSLGRAPEGVCSRGGGWGGGDLAAKSVHGTHRVEDGVEFFPAGESGGYRKHAGRSVPVVLDPGGRLRVGPRAVEHGARLVYHRRGRRDRGGRLEQGETRLGLLRTLDSGITLSTELGDICLHADGAGGCCAELRLEVNDLRLELGDLGLRLAPHVLPALGRFGRCHIVVRVARVQFRVFDVVFPERREIGEHLATNVAGVERAALGDAGL
jgi:hypothetical protein